MLDDQKELVVRIAENHRNAAGPLLQILHGIQDALGYIPEDAVPLLADVLNVTRAEVHGVVTFYHDFRSSPPGRHIIKICQAESCQATGSETVSASVADYLGISFHQTTNDRTFTLEPVYCLGGCAASPCMMVDGELHARLSPDRVRNILKEARLK